MKEPRRLFAAPLGWSLLLSVLLGGCAKGQEPVPAPLYLLDQSWQLTELNGQPVSTTDATPDEAITLTLSSVGSMGRGRAGRTPYHTGFLLIGGSGHLLFAADSLAATAASPSPARARYLALLPQVRRYTISHRHLQLFDATHAQPLLVFKLGS